MIKIPKEVTNPFSDAFTEKWELWKAFRWEEHKFKYKGVISEQMALKRLCEVAEGDEEKAGRIIDQSISRGWMDFYQLKQPSNNGKSSKSKQSNTSKDNGQSSLKDQSAAEFIRRNAEWEQPPSGTNLKAV